MALTAFTLNPADARDEHSRYASYLSIHRNLFKASSYDGEPTGAAAEFASYACTIGRTPIMSPPYIQSHPLVLRATPHWDQAGRAAMTVDLAMPQLPAQLGGLVAPTWVWNSWQTLRNGNLAEPDNNDRNSIFTTLTARVPYDHLLLPDPLYLDGVPILSTAIAAVAILLNHLNDTLAPFLRYLERLYTPANRTVR